MTYPADQVALLTNESATAQQFNTCFSGGFGTALSAGAAVERDHLVRLPLSVVEEQMKGDLSEGRGTVIISSSQQGQESFI